VANVEAVQGIGRYERKDAKSWAKETLRGYFVVTTTPFGPDLEIDEPGLRENVDRILAMPSCGGVYVGSIYQEFTSLQMDERKRVASIVLDQVASRVPVMVGVTANAVKDVVELGDHATDAGASLLMIWPPLFGDRTTEGVLAFYDTAIGALDLGVCLYASGFAELGFRLTPDMIEHLARHENVCAVKEASFNVGTYIETLRRLGERMVVSCPAEQFWLAGRKLVGERFAADVLLGSSRPLYAETETRGLTSEFLTAVNHGTETDVQEALYRVYSVAHKLTGAKQAAGAHSVSLVKEITGMLGMAAGHVRPPLYRSPPEARRRARDVLVEAGLLAGT
jgi:4-hydroxy-tetrahydrodipicolinate synthase